MKRIEDRVADWVDQLISDLDRATVVIAKIFFPILLGILLGYGWRIMQGF
ncbi:MAG: hypothetical protein JW884_14160 [Deltaproteobacteria bacterium]|nr:hypothetical protein [Deltaproteobacteria bacterium]